METVSGCEWALFFEGPVPPPGGDKEPFQLQKKLLGLDGKASAVCFFSYKIYGYDCQKLRKQ